MVVVFGRAVVAAFSVVRERLCVPDEHSGPKVKCLPGEGEAFGRVVVALASARQGLSLQHSRPRGRC